MLGIILLIAVVAPVVPPVDTSLIVVIQKVVHFVLQVNTAGTCPPLLLALRL